MALHFEGEIAINCDSVQVYREIEIATAKVPLDERRGIPHHLIDFVPPEINYTRLMGAACGCEKIEEIEARGQDGFACRRHRVLSAGAAPSLLSQPGDG